MAMAPFFFSILVLVFLPFSVTSQITHNNISLGSSLTTASKDSWLSLSGDFAFGFQQVNHNNNSLNGYLLCIVFDKIPERTVVWSANRNNLAPGGSTVQLTSDGRLVLTDPSGRQIWMPPNSEESANSPAVSYAAMLDTGSFMLASQNSSTIWQSFDVPTDTLLPTQILNRGSKLVANYSELDASEGRFNLFMQLDGNLVQYSTFYPEIRNNAPYWDTKTASSSGYRVVFNQSGFLNLISSNGTLLRNIFNPSVRVPQELYHRVTLDYDGVLRYYVYPKSNTSRSGLGWTKGWNILQFQPENVCGVVQGTIGSGACGFNSYCEMEDGVKPTCKCPKEYIFLDASDESKGCIQNFAPQDCRLQESDAFDLVAMPNVNFPDGDYESFETYTEEMCREACLSDCRCAVAFFGGTCWKKRLPVSNGRVVTGTSRKALIKWVQGSGASGTVYKGVLVDQQLVAVKRLDKMVNKTQDQEFRTEVKVIAGTNHKNLVKLVGFCNEGQHRILVYEFMSNGSLANLLFGDHSRPSWYTRVEIAYAVARGLVYLHDECSNQIIHCDIKPQNVLLDESLTAKISDFGLAKLLMANQTRTMTGIRGTKGYVAPEWFRNMPVTAKVDVHSFGILLLELVCCRYKIELEAEHEEEVILAEWAYECYSEGKLKRLVNNDLEALADMGKVERFVKVAIWCIQDDPSMRPGMKKVVHMLEGAVHVPPPLDPPSFISSI
ncbi:G-type lectin S-receptor-like serine/threonine-protein kinase LECRK1 [Linum perenne]